MKTYKIVVEFPGFFSKNKIEDWGLSYEEAVNQLSLDFTRFSLMPSIGGMEMPNDETFIIEDTSGEIDRIYRIEEE